MKKIFAILLAVTMLASMATVASAAENIKTTTLTTEVPAATYTLNIPADQEIPFGATITDIGELSISNSAGFAEGKNLQITLSYSDFACANVSTKIPFKVFAAPQEHIDDEMAEIYLVETGNTVVFKGQSNGTVRTYASAINNNSMSNIAVQVKSEDWGKALAGEYTATITFTAEVVAG